MATTTPNYGWPVPTSTDYVKDGATAIEALGDAIDATVFGLGSAGMTLISSTTMTAVSSQILTNVFSSTYDNYRVIFTGNGTVNGYNWLGFQLRTGTTTATTNYFSKAMHSDTNTASTTFASANVSNATFLTGSITNGSSAATGFDICRPFLATPTDMYGQTQGNFTGNSTYASIFWGTNTNSTSYNQLVLTPSSGTITGTVKVYGYRN